MAKGWTPVTDKVRAQILDANERGTPPREIARLAEVSPNTVYREIAKHSAKCRAAEKKIEETTAMVGDASKLLASLQEKLFPLATR